MKFNLNHRFYDLSVKAFKLEPSCTNQKSFYGKAIVIKDDKGNKYLQSYNTIVCAIDKNGDFYRFWDDYSVTTMNHINDFIYQYDIEGGGKHWWQSLEVENVSNFIQENTFTVKKVA